MFVSDRACAETAPIVFGDMTVSVPIVPSSIVSVLPTSEQAEAYELGERPKDTSLFEIMVFGFDDEPLFKMEKLYFDVKQRAGPNFDVRKILHPFAQVGVVLEELDSVHFKWHELPFEEGIRYYLMADGHDFERSTAASQLSHLFYRPLLTHRFHYGTYAKRVASEKAKEEVTYSAFRRAKETGEPYCAHLEDTAYTRDYYLADPSRPDESGRVAPAPCPDCGENRTRYAAVAVALPPATDQYQAGLIVQRCILLQTLGLLGIRELVMADTGRALVWTNQSYALAPDIACVVAALYDPSVREGMSRPEAIAAASKIEPIPCRAD